MIVTLPAATDCAAAGAICTASGKPLSTGLSATVTGPGTAITGLSLAPETAARADLVGRPDGLVADAADARLYAYRLADGARMPGGHRGRAGAHGTVVGPQGAMGGGSRGNLRAYRLADGMRLTERDVALPETASPVGLWSNGETAWVADWLGDTCAPTGFGRPVRARAGHPAGQGKPAAGGLWSDGETLWVADGESESTPTGCRAANGSRRRTSCPARPTSTRRACGRTGPRCCPPAGNAGR